MARTDVNIGCCSVTFNSVDLGNTAGDVKVKFDISTLEHSSDQTTLIEEIFQTARGVTVTCPFDETQLTQLQYSFPDGTYVLDSGGVKKKITLGDGTTIKLSGKAYALILDPINAASDNELVTIHKAVAVDVAEITFGKAVARIWNVTFKGLRDTTKSAGNRLLCIGDTTATA